MSSRTLVYLRDKHPNKQDSFLNNRNIRNLHTHVTREVGKDKVGLEGYGWL